MAETEMTSTTTWPAAHPHQEDIEQPLDTKISSPGGGGDETSVEFVRMERTKKWWQVKVDFTSRVVQSTALASAGVNLVALILVFNAAAVFAALFSITVAGAVVYYEFKLEDTETLRQIQNVLRKKVNEFAGLNVKLSQNNTRLETVLVPLKETEQKLASIAEEWGSDVNILRDLVKNNQKTLDEMNETLKADLLQDLMEAVMASERSQDGHFSDKEIKMLVTRLKGIPSIEVDEERFIEKVKLSRSISTVFDLMKTIEDDDIPEHERILKPIPTNCPK